MGKMLLIVVVGAGLIFSVISLNINTSSGSMIVNSAEEFENVMANNYSAAGIEFGIKSLSDDTTWTGINNKALNNGGFSVTVQNTSARYYGGQNAGLTKGRLITSIGTFGGSTDTIRVVVQLPEAEGSSAAPPFLDYAVFTGNNLTMNGNVTITDDNNNNWNANIHTNADFQMNGNNTINGFLTYVNNAHSNPAWKINNISPNVNPNNDPAYKKISTIDLPDYDPDDYKHLATQTYNNNVNLSGNRSLGTKENPEIIYVNGDLSLSGNITGYGMFLVKGNININGNVSVLSLDPKGNNLGLYVKGDVNINGNVNVKAQIYSNSNANLSGNVKIYGGVTTKGTVNFNGNVGIYYRPVTSSLTQPIWPVSGGSASLRPQIISYYEK